MDNLGPFGHNPVSKWRSYQSINSLTGFKIHTLLVIFVLTSSIRPLQGSTSTALKNSFESLFLKPLYNFTDKSKFQEELQTARGIINSTENQNNSNSIEKLFENSVTRNSFLYGKIFPRLHNHQMLEMTISLMNKTHPVQEVNKEVTKLLKLYSQDLDLSKMIKSSNTLNLNPTKVIIVSYKNFSPSKMMETLIERTKLFRTLWQSLKLNFPMSSIYLRNLGMEIIEVPEQLSVESFKELLKNYSNLINDVYEDHTIEDEDNNLGIEGDFKSDSFVYHNPDEIKSFELQEIITKNETEEASMENSSIRKLYTNVIPNDSGFNKQWAFLDSGDSEWGIEIQSVWKYSSTFKASEKFTIALIDSGVDSNHPDLKRSLWRNSAEICNNGIDDDGNGYIDDCNGWDFVNSDNNPMDDNGHGTASAGILAAQTNNGIGVAGMCWNCELMILKALNHQIKGSVSGFIRAVEYALEKGVKLSSNSYGGRGSNFDGLEEAIKRAQKQGMIFVAAAGNYKGNNDNDRNPVYPASYRMDNVVSVAAITRNGKLANFSSYGKKSVDIAAPGEKIYSTFLGPGYKYVDGTSFAVPFVTGAAAMIWSNYPHLTYKQVISTILDNQKPCPYLKGLTKTEGVLDLERAFGFYSTTSATSILSHQVMNTCSVNSDCDETRSLCQKDSNGHKCICKDGFEGDGLNCEDINECKYNPCGDVSTCYNKIGSFECICNKGFKRIDDNCEDLDECEDNTMCPPEAWCRNFAGTYECVCPEGYYWVTVNETYSKCTPNNSYTKDSCFDDLECPPNSFCKVHKSFWFNTRKCECLPGYTKDRETDLCIRDGIMSFQRDEYIDLMKSRSIVKDPYSNSNLNKGICFFGICF